jgi:hypothetical protein
MNYRKFVAAFARENNLFPGVTGLQTSILKASNFNTIPFFNKFDETIT